MIGFTNMAEIPGTPWRVHDAARPHPRVVTPGPTAERSAVRRHRALRRQGSVEVRALEGGQIVDAQWAVRDGYFEVGAEDR